MLAALGLIGGRAGAARWGPGQALQQPAPLSLNHAPSLPRALPFSSRLQVQDMLVVRRTVFYREHAAGTYSTAAFWLAELAAEIPFMILNALLYSAIVYFW